MSLFSVLSILGVAVGVWMLSVVHSVMNGFGENIRDLIGDTAGHIRIENASGRGVIKDYAAQIASAEKMPEVEVAAPYVAERAMLQYKNRPALPTVRTYTPTGDVIAFDEFMLYGDTAEFAGDVAVLTVGLASSIGVMVGSEIDMFTPNLYSADQDLAAPTPQRETASLNDTPVEGATNAAALDLGLDGDTGDEPVRLRTLKVVGIVETGYGQMDANTLFIPLPLMQELFDLHGGVQGVALRLTDRNLAVALAERLNASLPPAFHAVTWLDDHQDLLFVLRLEKTMMTLVIVVISVVAAFSIVITLVTTVISKTHEIGLYQALGGQPVQAGYVFCLQGLFIGIMGSVLGVVAAVVSLHYRNEILHVFYGKAEMIYNPFLNLPSSYTVGDLILFAVLATVLSTLAGLLPSRMAARLQPAEALREPC